MRDDAIGHLLYVLADSGHFRFDPADIHIVLRTFMFERLIQQEYDHAGVVGQIPITVILFYILSLPFLDENFPANHRARYFK